MKIVLIHPEGSNWIIGQKDVSASFNRMAPLGILSLAAYLDSKGVEVKVIDFFGAGSSVNQARAIEDVVKWKPDLIGFTATTSSFLDAYSKTEYIKKLDPGLKVIFGGVHTSSLGAKALEKFPLIDYAVIGEGEKTVLELLNGANPAGIQGLAYRDNGEVRFTGFRTDLCELDDLPIPAYHMLNNFPSAYKLPPFNSPAKRGATIISSRGCPYVCSYCDRSVYGKSFRYNSAQYLLEHMKSMYKRFGIRHFNIYDDLFTLKRKRVEEFCDLLGASNYRFTFNCAARIGHADAKLIRSLKKGGCWMMSLGIESGDQELLDKHKSGVSLAEVRETVALIQSEGIQVKGLFIMGLPGETRETIRNTQKYILSLKLDDMSLAKFAPFPGSPSYETIHEHGKFEEDWNALNCLNFVFLPKGFRDFREMNQIYAEFVKSFYLSPTSRKRFLYYIFRHPHNLVMILKNLKAILQAKKQFTPETHKEAEA